jgi:hypothetical protein
MNQVQGHRVQEVGCKFESGLSWRLEVSGLRCEGGWMRV